MDPAFNPQNDRYICFYDDDEEVDVSSDEEDQDGRGGGATVAAVATRHGKFIARSKHPGSAMFLGAVAPTGEVSLSIWFPTGFRLGAEAYIAALRDHIVLWMRRVVASRGHVANIFQQDSSPAHRANKRF